MTFKKCNVSGSVTLYNSGLQVIANIHSYLDQIDHLFVIDNSEMLNNELVEQIIMLPNVTYISNKDNLGVAHALNQAANMAIAAGYQFLLTMDDDTNFPYNGVNEMLAFANQHNTDKLGIIAGQSDPKHFSNTVKSVSYTITSGNLLNLSAFKECGHFIEELFIDFVDHEYCFRLKKYGYEIIEINSVQLDHKLGQKKQLNLLGYKLPFHWRSHNPLRIYYKTRNCIFSLKKHNLIEVKIKYFFTKEIFKDILKTIFLEDKKKVRIILVIKGLYDGLKGNLGKKVFEI